MKQFFILLVLLTNSLTLFSQERLIIRFTNPDPVIVKHFASNNYDIAAFHPGVFLDLVVTEDHYKELLSQGFEAEIFQTESEMRANLTSKADNIPGYRGYVQALADLQLLEATYPDICKLYDIGDSRGKVYYNEGKQNYVNYQHDIWALKVSDNVELDEDEPAIYYMGAHHAREPLSTEVAFYVLDHIIENYGVDPVITENVNSKEIWFIPIVNPDGQKIVLDQTDTNWRKNIRDNDNNNQITFSNNGWSYPDGVDINRNYGWQFGTEGTSFDPTDVTYCGPSKFSEPETSAIRDLMASRHFVAGISYHTYSELVLWPYGYTTNAIGPDNAAISALGTAMGNSIPKLGSGTYTPQPSWALYPSSGVTDDYAYGEHGIFSYTIELGTQFIPPASQILQICQANIQAAMILLNRVNTSTLTGHITNSNTGEPVVAEIYVDGIDNTGLYRKPYKSNENFGRYYRFLPNGNYNVTISAFGYITQTFQNININNVGQTILDVQLVPCQSFTVTGTVTDIDTGEPIANASIVVIDTPLPTFYTDENGNYTIPSIFENTYSFKIWALNYATLIQEITINAQNLQFDFELTETNAVSFETGVFPEGWTFGGNANWTIVNTAAWDGEYSARSGAIGNNQKSEMKFTVIAANAGVISFYVKVSSEANYDFLRFYVNEQQKGAWSGELNWTEVSIPVNAGTNNFKWVYQKDIYVSSGSDCAWVDYIIFQPSATINANAGTDTEICADETHQCQGTASFYNSVTWSTSGDGQFSNASSLTPIYTPGTTDISNGGVTLSLTAYGDGGTSKTDQMILTIKPLPGTGTQITGIDEVCAGNSETYFCEIIDDADEYEWNIQPSNAGQITIQNDNEIMVEWNINYEGEAILTVRGTNECGYGDYSDDFMVTILDCSYIDEIDNQNATIYPNPAKDQIIIYPNPNMEGVLSLKIFNNLGVVIHKANYQYKATENIVVDLKNTISGVYYVQINTERHSFIKKLIINKDM